MKKKKNNKIDFDTDIDIINNDEYNEIKINDTKKKKNKKEIKLKKHNPLTTILSIVLLIAIIVFIFSLIDYLKVKNTEYTTKKEITNYTKLVNNTDTQNKDIENEINKIKEEVKNKVEEYDIWEYLKEQVNKALS